jgi:tetratricopeptide (TPR) repeat protein
MSHIALYMGWYEANASGPFAQANVEFMPGAFAYHLHSYNSPSLHTAEKHWAGPLLAKGATATIGYVEEPYLQGTINLPHFLTAWIRGFTYGEAAYVAQNVLSWQTTVVGDPLYRPFLRPADQLHNDLLRAKNPLFAWSILRAINQNMSLGDPSSKFVPMLERDLLARSSVILQEKLAELYASDNKLTDAADTWLHALTLKPSPLQRVRITLELASRLPLIGRGARAVELLEELRKDLPDYPDQPALLRPLVKISGQLGKTSEQAKYQAELDRIVPPSNAATNAVTPAR